MADPVARRRSRSEISSADASSDEDDFYDAAEYDGQQASAAAASLTSPAGAAPVTAATANGANAANTGTSAADTVSAAAAALSHMQVQAGGATSGAAAAASHPSPQPPLSSSRPQSTSVEARVAPLAVSTNTANPVSVDTATPLGPSGSPVALPQPLASAPSSTMTAPPARPPRPSYSLPGSATTTPQSTLKGPLNLSQLAAGMIPPIPARSSPIVSAGTMTHSAAGSSATSSVSSSLTSSPIPAQRLPPVQPRPYAHSQPTSPPGASPSSAAAAATAAGGLPFTIKNLDTGETCDLAEATSVFPEVERAMTLKAFEAEASAGAAAAAAAATPAAVVTPEAREEVAEKKKNLGLMSRLKQALHLKDKSSGGDDESNTVKVKTRHRSFQDLTDVKLVQTLVQHAGPVWTVAISNQGDFIATGGQDSIVRVWAVMGSTAARELDEKLRAQKAQQDAAAAAAAAAGGSLHVQGNIEVTSVSGGVPVSPASVPDLGGHSPVELPNLEQEYKENGSRPIVYPVPYRTYAGHKADVIDLAWSKANFLLSASIDKTVRLWHVSRQKCLCVFQHADFVTAVAWHPVEDRYFVSGSFDKKLRIWNIPEHRVVEWAQTSNIITAATFNPNGNMTVAGLYNGSAIFYQTDGLKYFTQVDAKNRHGRNRKGKKVTGMQFSPDGKSLLVTTNDSRIRLYDMDDYSLAAKFKGTENDELQIRAWFSPDGRHVICGGENQHVVVWSAAEYTAQASGDANGHGGGAGGPGSTNGSADVSGSSSSSSKPDVKCDSSESFRAFTDTCTSAQFLPPNTIRLSAESDVDAAKIRHLIIAAGYGGEIKLFENRGARKAT